METIVEPINDSSLERVKIINPPYTVYGHSVLLPSFSITMEVKGLREILSLASNNDSLRIVLHDKKATEYQIIRNKTAATQETGRPEGPQPLGEPNPRSGGIPNGEETVGQYLDRRQKEGAI